MWIWNKFSFFPRSTPWWSPFFIFQLAHYQSNSSTAYNLTSNWLPLMRIFIWQNLRALYAGFLNRIKKKKEEVYLCYINTDYGGPSGYGYGHVCMCFGGREGKALSYIGAGCCVILVCLVSYSRVFLCYPFYFFSEKKRSNRPRIKRETYTKWPAMFIEELKKQKKKCFWQRENLSLGFKLTMLFCKFFWTVRANVILPNSSEPKRCLSPLSFGRGKKNLFSTVAPPPPFFLVASDGSLSRSFLFYFAA